MTTSLTYEQICALEEAISNKDDFYTQINSIWLAMTDWPTGLDETDDLLKVLHEQIEGELSKSNLTTYFNDLNKNLGLSGNGWKSETIASLLNLYSFHTDARTLEEIFHQFSITAQSMLKSMK